MNDINTLDTLDAMGPLHAVEVVHDPLLPNSPGVPDFESTPFLIPRQLTRPSCLECASAARPERGDVIAFIHQQGCGVAELEERQASSDYVRLVALDQRGEPTRLQRTTRTWEVDALLDQRLAATTSTPCVVTIDEDGHTQRSWPSLRDQA